MTKKELETIKQAYHIGDVGYSRTIHVELLVNEVEALWREKKRMAKAAEFWKFPYS
jgi:hypothetical protein